MSAQPQSAPSPVLLFDGVCNLCDWSVQFVLDHDEEGRIHFASLQSDAGRALLASCGLNPGVMDSVVFVEGGRCSVRSDAALRVARHLAPPWRWIAALAAVPRPVRDRAYDWVARHRYRWFGTRSSCRVPTPQTRARFLDADESAVSPAKPPVARSGPAS